MHTQMLSCWRAAHATLNVTILCRLRLRNPWDPHTELGSVGSPHGICNKVDVGAPVGLRSVTLLLNTLLLSRSGRAVNGGPRSLIVPHVPQAIAMHSDCIFKKEQAMCLEKIQRANDLMGLNESSPGE